MDKRFWICGILVSIAALLLDFIVHGLLLQGDYNALVEAGSCVRRKMPTTTCPTWLPRTC